MLATFVAISTASLWLWVSEGGEEEEEEEAVGETLRGLRPATTWGDVLGEWLRGAANAARVLFNLALMSALLCSVAYLVFHPTKERRMDSPVEVRCGAEEEETFELEGYLLTDEESRLSLMMMMTGELRYRAPTEMEEAGVSFPGAIGLPPSIALRQGFPTYYVVFVPPVGTPSNF